MDKDTTPLSKTITDASMKASSRKSVGGKIADRLKTFETTPEPDPVVEEDPPPAAPDPPLSSLP